MWVSSAQWGKIQSSHILQNTKTTLHVILSLTVLHLEKQRKQSLIIPATISFLSNSHPASWKTLQCRSQYSNPVCILCKFFQYLECLVLYPSTFILHFKMNHFWAVFYHRYQSCLENSGKLSALSSSCPQLFCNTPWLNGLLREKRQTSYMQLLAYSQD